MTADGDTAPAVSTVPEDVRRLAEAMPELRRIAAMEHSVTTRQMFLLWDNLPLLLDLAERELSASRG
jgi:hypothetical protein